jgi:predicted enzyme related to lactoylglutathione lyase
VVNWEDAGMVDVASVVLFAADLARTVTFYRLLGIALQREQDGDGPAYAATDLGGVRVAVYQAPAPASAPPAFLEGGGTFVGFYVDSLDDTLAAVAGSGAPVLVAHEVRPWGCRAVVTDPDGRPVEINQRNHCG